MSDGPDTLIQLAFCAWLRDGALGFPIAWPFTIYSPAFGISFLDVRGVLRAAPNSPGLAANSSVQRVGLFQIDAVTPTDAGEAPGIRMAEAVSARFARGVSFPAGAYLVRLIFPSTIAAAVMDAPWLRFPVSIPYRMST